MVMIQGWSSVQDDLVEGQSAEGPHPVQGGDKGPGEADRAWMQPQGVHDHQVQWAQRSGSVWESHPVFKQNNHHIQLQRAICITFNCRDVGTHLSGTGFCDLPGSQPLHLGSRVPWGKLFLPWRTQYPAGLRSLRTGFWHPWCRGYRLSVCFDDDNDACLSKGVRWKSRG